jgi:hypothetical protein
MNSLQEMLGEEQGNAAVDQIAQASGADNTAVNSVVQTALPMLIGGLANNASSTEGAQSLGNALQNHDGSILDNIGGLAGSFLGGGQGGVFQSAASGILGHVFGGNQSAVTDQVAQHTGVGSGEVGKILMMLAPLVMGYLGRQTTQQGIGSEGLGGLLGGLLGGQSQAAGGSWTNIATNMLDKDRDGSAVDDIASEAMNYLKNR